MEPYQNQPQDLTRLELPAPHRHFFNKKFITTLVVILALGGTAFASQWWWEQMELARQDEVLLDMPIVSDQPELDQASNPPEGQFCGGIAGVMCPSGYSCKLEGSYPDAGGACKKDGQVCAQVITRAKNQQTGEMKDFPTPCDVPSGWDKI